MAEHRHPGAYSSACPACWAWDRTADWLGEHPHWTEYSPSCPACQADDEAEGRLYDTMSSTGRTSRPAPMSARNVRIQHAERRLHRPDCRCRSCHPFQSGWGMLLFVWACRQFWYWTPVGQLIYWTFALAALATYP
jgi:hypothetical protein